MVRSREKILQKAQSVDKETKEIEFKETFSADSTRDWCEIVKDIIAISNSGGGCILIGVKNDGASSDSCIVDTLNLDPAQVTDKIAKYTGQQFSQFEVKPIDRHGKKVLALLIDDAHVPIVFTKLGTYDIGGGRQHTAFQAGTVYFRHGAKSEPGNSDDLKDAIERELRRMRRFWLSNVRKIVNASPEYKVLALPPHVKLDAALTATPIRITDEPGAPALRLETPDTTHPLRQKDVIQAVNRRLEGKKTVNAYDIWCVRKVHGIDTAKPQYYYKPKFGSPQYSQAFVDWLVRSYEQDPSFFDKAREKYGSAKE